MKTLMQAAEQWVRELIFECGNGALFGQRVDDVEEVMREYMAVQSRDANRIAALERKVLEKFSVRLQREAIFHRLDTIAITMDNITDTLDTLESELYDTTRRVDDVESGYGDTDADKVSCEDLHSMVIDILNEAQLTVTASPVTRILEEQEL